MKVHNILAVALSGLMIISLTGCRDKEAEAAAAAEAQKMHPLHVSVMNLHQQDVDLVSTWFGHLRGVEQADIMPEVSGKLLRQIYWDGSLCEEGEVLFEIDPSTYKAAVDQAEASVAAAKASVLQARATDDRAKQDVDRYAKLVGTGSISEKNYTDALQTKKETEAALAAAEAQVKQAEAALENARINLDRCTIRAPFKGLASKSTVSVGDLISAGSKALTSMSSIDPIRVDFAVPGKHMMGKIFSPDFDPTAGMVTPIDDFEIIMEDGTVFEHRGRVVAVDSEVSLSSGTVNFVGHVPNPQLKLRAGSAVRVRAKTGVEKDAFLVPSRALVSSMNHRYIYVVGPDQRPYGIDVQAGREVVLNMPNGDGKTVPMLMQVVTGTVKPLADTLRELGIENPTEAPVIVEGGQMAALYAKANEGLQAAGAKGGFGTVVPRPFVYTQPESTTPSVTAK